MKLTTDNIGYVQSFLNALDNNSSDTDVFIDTPFEISSTDWPGTLIVLRVDGEYVLDITS